MNIVNASNKYWIILVVILHISCKKLVEIPSPTGSIAQDNVYTTDGTAIGVLNGFYIAMNNTGITAPITGNGSISLVTGLSSDELTLYSGVSNQIYRRYFNNELLENGIVSAGSQYWSTLYNYIFKCNAAIEGLTETNSLTPIIKQQLLGEAKFLRGFFYFYLVNLFGDVPLALTTDPKVNTLLYRASTNEVYSQIIADLESAQDMLSTTYLDASLLNNTLERVRPTKWAAIAMLARSYLYSGDFAKAEVKATELIENASLFSMPQLNSVFLKNSNEAVWQLQPTGANFNTRDAVTFILTSNGPEANADRGIYLSSQILKAFEGGDKRRFNRNWIDSIIYNGSIYYFPYKYKQNISNSNITGVNGVQYMTEYLMILRLAEQYLIRAEARVQQSNIKGAQEDLNLIRIRAGLGSTSATEKSLLLDAIFHERQVELFTEWGHRWLDLKRTHQIDQVMGTVTSLKGGIWDSHDQLYPLPLTELQNAPNLVQNDGY